MLMGTFCKILPISALALVVWLAPLTADQAPGDETRTLAFRNLQRLVQEEERILERSRRGDGTFDLERVQRGFQDLVPRYEAFLGDNPNYAPGYVAYGLMLDRAGESELASRMFLRANQLDPNIPVVKNQLGNYMAEQEKPDQALPYYLAAIELEPEEPLYHYQLGTLLAEFRQTFLDLEMFEPRALDSALQEAFRLAAELSPAEVAFAYRYAESFYDVADPDWDAALAAWEAMAERVRPGVERQTIILHRANIHLLKGEPNRARRLLTEVTAPALQSNKERLLERLE